MGMEAGEELLGLESSSQGWKGADRAGEELTDPGAVCELQGEPQDLQFFPKPAPGSANLLKRAGP